MGLSGSRSNPVLSSRPLPTQSILLVGIWFAVIGGLSEGLGLLSFQWVNWQSWGKFLHVSADIVWISPTLDLLFFLLIGFALAPILPRLRWLQVVPTAFIVFSTLTFYDWFVLSQRLSRRSSFILALGLASALNRLFSKHQEQILEFLGHNLKWLGLALVAAVVGIHGTQLIREHLFLSRLPAASAGSPNVLVIVVDALRADHLSSYGYSRRTSPHLDRLAQQGALFENAFSASSWTLPSHTSLLTGRYPHEHRATEMKPGRPYDHRFPIIAETFGEHGYRTGAFSANTMFFTRDMGLNYGFAHFEDYFSSPSDVFVRTVWGKEVARLLLGNRYGRALLAWLGVPYYREVDADGDYDMSSEDLGLVIKRRAPNVNESLLAWLDRDHSRPWFAFLNYMDVHPPYRQPSDSEQVPHAKRRELWAKLYDDDIVFFDQYFGELLDALARRNLIQNTMVVFTSDHGELFGEHGLYRHQNALYRQVIHVPLIFWKPGTVPAVKVEAPVTNVDIPATLVDILGWGREDHFPGSSLRELWRNPAASSSRRPVLSELAQFRYRPANYPCHSGPMKSLIVGKWQYILHERLGPELYDWSRDADENNNLLLDPKYQGLAAKFAVMLQAAIGRTRPRSTMEVDIYPSKVFDAPIGAARNALLAGDSRTIHYVHCLHAEKGSPSAACR